jgi:hypothetical protein
MKTILYSPDLLVISSLEGSYPDDYSACSGESHRRIMHMTTEEPMEEEKCVT